MPGSVALQTVRLGDDEDENDETAGMTEEEKEAYYRQKEAKAHALTLEMACTISSQPLALYSFATYTRPYGSPCGFTAGRRPPLRRGQAA